MNFILDVHCHTVASGHAYSTLSENAAHAASIGLTHIAIADHGPAMPGGAHLYSIYNQECLPDYIHGVKIIKSAEVNITDAKGGLDLPDELLARLDLAIASLHRVVCTPSKKDIHTRSLINAMQHPCVNILGHPIDTHFEIDIKAVVLEAARTNTIIEINNHSLSPASFRYSKEGDAPHMELLALCKEHNVPVIAASDAHFCTSVGNFTHAKALIELAGMPEDLVLNTCADRLFDAVRKKKNSKEH